jgi:hypothetical protein
MSPIKTKPVNLSRYLSLLLIGLLLAGAAFYIAFQARFLILGPQVELTGVPATVQNGPTVDLKGVAKNITALYLNGRPIVTTEDGRFNETVVLEKGYTIVRIDAIDRYGRTANIEQEFVYQGSQLPTVELSLLENR